MIASNKEHGYMTCEVDRLEHQISAWKRGRVGAKPGVVGYFTKVHKCLKTGDLPRVKRSCEQARIETNLGLSGARRLRLCEPLMFQKNIRTQNVLASGRLSHHNQR
jgi:hypothetical protein